MSFIETCRQFIAIESTPTSGNHEMASFIEVFCKERGFHVELQQEVLNGIEQANVIIRAGEKQSGEELLMLTHLDTPDPGSYALWTRTMSNPFKMSVYEKEIFGLGVANSKLDFLCKILAAEKFLGKKLKMPFVLVGTYGEEDGMVGALKLVRRKKIKATKALIGEPTNLQLVNAGSGVIIVEVNIPFSEEEKNYHHQHNVMESTTTQSKMFTGRAAHSSHPHLGDNAIVKMLDYISNLPDGIVLMELDGGISHNTVPSSAFLEIDMVGGFKETAVTKVSRIMETLRAVEKEFQNYAEEGFSPKVSTLNIGQIRTNKEGLRILGSCRVLPSVPEDVYERWINDIKASCSEVGALFRVASNRTSFFTSKSSDFVNICQNLMSDIGLDKNLGRTTVCTEASILSRMGIECLVFGPGQGVGNVNAPNEKISLDDLGKATEFYEKVIERICL